MEEEDEVEEKEDHQPQRGSPCLQPRERVAKSGILYIKLHKPNLKYNHEKNVPNN